MDQTLAAILNGVGVVGVIALGGWLIASGRLVTRRELDQMVEDHVREVTDIAHDRDEWRAAHRISETARVEEREHNAALIEDIAKPVKEFLAAFRNRAAARRDEDQ